MRKGKISHGRARSPSRPARSLLLRKRILDCLGRPDGHPADDDFAGFVAVTLRSVHAEYRLIKPLPFALWVSQVLKSIHNVPPPAPAASQDHISSSSATSGSATTSRKHPASDSSAASFTLSRKKPHCGRRRHVVLENLDSSDDGEYSNGLSSKGSGLHPAQPDFDVIKSSLRDSYKKNLAKPKQHDSFIEEAPKLSEESASAKSKLTNNKEEHDLKIDMATEQLKVAVTNNVPVKETRTDTTRDENISGRHESDVGPRFSDFGGMEWVIDMLCRKVIMLLWHPEVKRHLGVEQPSTGFLLHGPPGCGKSTLAHAIANEAGVPFYRISAPDIFSSVAGTSEGNVNDLFTKASRTAPSIIFIDEIDSIASKRENLQNKMDRRIVNQLIISMDELHRGVKDRELAADPSQDKLPGYVVVIGATNRPDEIDPALRRSGRFDQEILLGIPDEAARFEILSMVTRKLRMEGEIDLCKIARLTSGYVGADLKSLVAEAAEMAFSSIMDKKIASSLNEMNLRQPWSKEELENVSITMADFKNAAKTVQPSLKREGFSSIPDVTWDDVGGLNSIREVFKDEIVGRIKHPEDIKELGIRSKPGFLLFGPPGCGKTLIAKAVANEAGVNFIHVKGPELLNKYVGESESTVRKIFTRARACTPCILFFDEIDAIARSRGTERGAVAERVLLQLLVELDRGVDRQGVYAIGATNRIEELDPAMLRPGRLGGTIMYVPLPNPDERVAIMKAYARNMPIDANVDFSSLARTEKCNNLSGADLCNLIDQAAKYAFRDKQKRREQASGTSFSYKNSIEATHFERALSQMTPSISEKQRNYYEALSKRYQAGCGT